MSFATRLKEQRIRMGLTQVQLANALGVSKGDVGNYEIGTSSPKADNLYQLFDILKCDANYLFQDEMRELHEAHATPDEMENLVKKYRTLDGHGKEMVDFVLDKEAERVAEELRLKFQSSPKTPDETIQLPVNLAAAAEGDGFGAWLDNDCNPISVQLNSTTRKADMVIKVQGRSMEPSYQDGDYVLVRFQPDIEVGEVGIWTIDGLGYVKERGEDRLISQNPDISDIIIGEQECICVGKVISKLPLEWIENI